MYENFIHVSAGQCVLYNPDTLGDVGCFARTSCGQREVSKFDVECWMLDVGSACWICMLDKIVTVVFANPPHDEPINSTEIS